MSNPCLAGVSIRSYSQRRVVPSNEGIVGGELRQLELDARALDDTPGRERRHIPLPSHKMRRRQRHRIGQDQGLALIGQQRDLPCPTFLRQALDRGKHVVLVVFKDDLGGLHVHTGHGQAKPKRGSFDAISVMHLIGLSHPDGRLRFLG